MELSVWSWVSSRSRSNGTEIFSGPGLKKIWICIDGLPCHHPMVLYRKAGLNDHNRRDLGLGKLTVDPRHLLSMSMRSRFRVKSTVVDKTKFASRPATLPTEYRDGHAKGGDPWPPPAPSLHSTPLSSSTQIFMYRDTLFTKRSSRHLPQ